MQIEFKRFTEHYLPLYFSWAEKEHVKSKWFRDGYSTVESIRTKIDGSDKYVHPFVIIFNEKPIGYIQYYEMVSGTIWKEMESEPEGTVGFDLFIGEEDFLSKGYGSKIVAEFASMLFKNSEITRIIVDPFTDDQRAIKCYEKAGFSFVRQGIDDVGAGIYIMEKLLPWRQNGHLQNN